MKRATLILMLLCIVSFFSLYVYLASEEKNRYRLSISELPLENVTVLFSRVMSHKNTTSPTKERITVLTSNLSQKSQKATAKATASQRPTAITVRTITTSKPTTDTRSAGSVYRCPFPKLDPHDPVIDKYIDTYPPLTCNGKPSVAYLENDEIKIDQKKMKEKVGPYEYCQYTPLELSSENDLHLQDPKWTPEFTHGAEIPNALEHVLLQCLYKGEVVAETYKSRVFEKPDVEKRSKQRYAEHVKNNSPAETMSLLFVGMDGMSKQNLIRGLPKTRNFLLQTMNAKELNMFNKVGDNTFQNIIVLMSGKIHIDFENMKGWDLKNDYFDDVDHMMVWNAFQQAGYRTASIFDITYGTAFHYLKKGWKKPPFDYYHRPGPLMIDKRSKKDPNSNCVGDQREVSLLLDYYVQLTSVFNNTKNKPYFAYSFFTHLTHDWQNYASMGDEMYLEFFVKLHDRNVLNNTVLIFFSDHGMRFGDMRYLCYDWSTEFPVWAPVLVFMGEVAGLRPSVLFLNILTETVPLDLYI